MSCDARSPVGGKVIAELIVLCGREHGARHHPLPAAPPQAWGLPVSVEDSIETNE